MWNDSNNIPISMGISINIISYMSSDVIDNPTVISIGISSNKAQQSNLRIRSNIITVPISISSIRKQ